MRLFLLPISTRKSLIYCQKRSRLSRQSSYIDRVTSKASEKWLEWEKFEKGWQKKVTVYGNKLFQRLPFEEWGLKSVPPLSVERRKQELEGKKKSIVEYPESVLKVEKVMRVLQEYGSDARQSYHRKWLWRSIIGMPFTLPVGLIPILPNLPFFYLAFRAWSHWRAQRGSEHIEFLLDNKLFDLASSSTLDAAYMVQNIGVSIRGIRKELEELRKKKTGVEESITASQEQRDQMLLSRKDGALMARCVEIPELGPEVERAVWQVERAIEANRALVKEKAKLEQASSK